MKKVFLMLAVVAMASCSKSELTTRPEVAGDVEIKAGSTVLAIETKAPYMNELNALDQSLTAYVQITKDLTNYTYKTDAATPANSTLLGKGYMNFKHNGTNVPEVGFYGEEACTTHTPQYYPSDGSNIAMVALYPATVGGANGWDITTDTDCKTATFTINGKTDVMAAVAEKSNASEATDINKSTATATNLNMFKFGHKLTLVNIQVYGDAAAATAWGNITGIELKGVYDGTNLSTDVNDQIKVTYKDASAVSAKSAAGKSMPFYQANANTTTPSTIDSYTENEITTSNVVVIPTVPTAVAYSMVAPFKATADAGKENMHLVIKTEKGPAAGYDLKIQYLRKADDSDNFKDSTEGKMFTIKLKFMASEIKASASVDKWVDDAISVPEQEIK